MVQDVMPTTAQRYDGATEEFENISKSQTSMDSESSSITVSMYWVISLVLCFPNRIQYTSISGNRIECGSVCLAPKSSRTLSYDAAFISLFVPPSRGQAASMVRSTKF